MSTPDPPRLPPGQERVDALPALHVGSVPAFDPETWQLSIGGAVAEPRVLGWQAFRSLPASVLRADLHCVTGWSRLDLSWRGVRLTDLIDLAGALPDAGWIAVADGRGYEASLSLADARAGDVRLVFELDGEPLAPVHGGPLRVVVPDRYGWKSVKWVRGVVLLENPRPGFWDRRGFHADGDPWREERMA